ncbi:hypothetical protein [Pseudomonas protegens]|uniref:hypothetical protein n=1 Tax=Pseudomonas protegens TaxID=380021 RepID=UPI0024C29530|nr:hypothetical protein [Pseudomonas protegens]MDK1394667.1 hypothetical protein [Pseudomonas protegens]
MPAARFVTDSLSIAKATPKRRHIDLKSSLAAALNEFVELEVFNRSVDTDGLSSWAFIGGQVAAQEAFYEDSLQRRFVLIQLTRDAAFGVVLRARHSGDRAALAEAIRVSYSEKISINQG